MLMTKNNEFSKVGYDTQPSESTVAELANGSLLLNVRDSLNVLDRPGDERCGCRLLARSDNGGKTWVQFWNVRRPLASDFSDWVALLIPQLWLERSRIW